MTQAFVEKNTAIKRISETIDQIMESKIIYQELDKNQLIQTFSKLLDKVSPQMIISLDDEQLTKRVRGVMATKLLSTIFDDFTQEQIEMFEAAVEGR